MFPPRSVPFPKKLKRDSACWLVAGVVCSLAMSGVLTCGVAGQDVALTKVTAEVVFHDPLDVVDRAKSRCQDASPDKLPDCFGIGSPGGRWILPM